MLVICLLKFKMNLFLLIRQSIVDECNESLYWSVMADEAVDVSTVEQVSICIRYVNVKSDELEICEAFLGFTSVPSTTAEVLTTAIDSSLKDSGLDLLVRVLMVRVDTFLAFQLDCTPRQSTIHTVGIMP